jgi:PAS domain S-box-containing protein
MREFIDANRLLIGLVIAGILAYLGWFLHMEDATPEMLFSIITRLSAASIAFLAVIYWKDWRLILAGLMFTLMASRQILTALIHSERLDNTPFIQSISEIPGFVVTILGLGFIIYIWKLFSYREEGLKAKEELMLNERKFRLFASYANDWEYWKNTNGQFIFISPSFRTITGFETDAFHNEEEMMRRIIHPEDWHLWAEHKHEILEGEEKGHATFRIITHEGSIRWIHHVCRVITDERGNPIGVRGSNRDITKMHRLEDELEELRKVVPVCSSCRTIRNDQAYWNAVEHFLIHKAGKYSEYGQCPKCQATKEKKSNTENSSIL